MGEAVHGLREVEVCQLSPGLHVCLVPASLRASSEVAIVYVPSARLMRCLAQGHGGHVKEAGWAMTTSFTRNQVPPEAAAAASLHF